MDQHKSSARSGVERAFAQERRPYRIIFRKVLDRAVVEISAILIRAKDSYR